MRNWVFLIFICAIILEFGCSKDDEVITPIDDPVIDLVNEILDIAEHNSIKRELLDWSTLRDEVLTTYGQSDLLKAIEVLLTSLADNHSFYVHPTGNRVVRYSAIQCGQSFSISNLAGPKIGYIKVPGFSGSQEEAKAFAQNIQDEIKSQDSPDIRGWVVDLSKNTGGNMYPMVAGLGPILGDGVLGHFIYPNDLTIQWGYFSDGSYINSSANKAVMVDRPYQLLNQDTKVAVVIDDQTASSGEATFISFLGQSNTMTFGQPTCGLSTANQLYELSNGGELYLTVAVMADRNLIPYGDEIAPDFISSNTAEIETQIKAWIND